MVAWSPFEQERIPNQSISLELKGSLLENPFDQMVFTHLLDFEDLVC